MHPPFHINYLVETVDPRPVSYLNNVEGLSSVGFVNLSLREQPDRLRTQMEV